MHLNTDIHNYYEHLVVEYIIEKDLKAIHDKDFLADVSCLALNQLPPRYIRHDVDMAFYLTSSKRTEMTDEVAAAMEHSLFYMLKKQA